MTNKLAVTRWMCTQKLTRGRRIRISLITNKHVTKYKITYRLKLPAFLWRKRRTHGTTVIDMWNQLCGESNSNGPSPLPPHTVVKQIRCLFTDKHLVLSHSILVAWEFISEITNTLRCVHHSLCKISSFKLRQIWNSSEFKHFVN